VWNDSRIPDIAVTVTGWLVDRLMLGSGESVLEIAGGSGLLSLATAATGRPAMVICSDVDVAAVEAARESANPEPRRDQPDIVFLAADMLRLPFQDAAFDAIVCRWGFMFAPDPKVPFHEAGRVLRPGGRLAFAVWGTPEQNPWQSILDDTLTAFGVEDRTPQRNYGGMFGLADEPSLRTMLEDAGFSAVEVDRVPLVRHYRDFDEYWSVEVDVGGEGFTQLHDLSTADAEAFRGRLVDGLSRYLGAGSYEIPGVVIAVAAVAHRRRMPPGPESE
jgi:ubiquinone/menaquinone biosynthesis C-methylase UbiE